MKIINTMACAIMPPKMAQQMVFGCEIINSFAVTARLDTDTEPRKVAHVL